MNTADTKEQGFATGVLLILTTVGFIASLAFGVWAFSEAQTNQTDLDKKIADATVVAVQEAETAKEAEFAEREKEPFQSYTGSQIYGSLSFEYPKTWSAYAVEDDSGTILDFYAHPKVIPGLSRDVNFAFRAQIVDKPYEELVSRLDGDVKSGEITVSAYRAPRVPSELGVFIGGEVVSSKQGVMIMLPQRDKTFVLWTESEEYIGDFNKLAETMTFDP